jgi:2'-5' RNA ligase
VGTIRAFIAVDLPAAVKMALAGIAADLDRTLSPGAVRWVRPEAMHLTLRFLGDTDVERLPAISSGLDEIAAAHRPFEMRLGRPGCFPGTRRPRVIWVGLAGNEPQLLDLKAGLDRALAPLGWPVEDKTFHPHLTLGRVKEEGRLRDYSPEAVVPPLVVPVATLLLIESDLRPQGPRYTVRHSAALGQA